MSDKKRQREAALFERFSRAYSVPEGRVVRDERPDFRVHTSTQGVLGVEVTELYQESGATGPQG
jgi:hypothetical protein